VRLLGGDPRRRSVRRDVGDAPQEVGFPPTLRVREVARLVARHYPAAHDPADTLERFGVLDLSARQTGGLSGGQRRRLAVALAFLGRPRLVVLDEPTAGLDGEGRRAVWSAIDAARRRSSAILLATHHLEEADAAASLIVAINRGRVVADGSIDEIKARAGRTRIVFAADPTQLPRWLDATPTRNGRIVVDTDDAAAVVARLVRAGVPLLGLEVRPLRLDEALDALLEEPSP
jgi:ABC-2 type transport system ATP-binding protein